MAVPKTASRKKLALSASSTLSTAALASGPVSMAAEPGERLAGKEENGYRLLRLDKVQNALGIFPYCHSSLRLKESFIHRRGLVSNISSVCSKPHCPWSRNICDPHNAEDNVINEAAIVGMCMGGQGHHTLNELTACIEMLPPYEDASWNMHNIAISKKCVEVAKADQRRWL